MAGSRPAPTSGSCRSRRGERRGGEVRRPGRVVVPGGAAGARGLARRGARARQQLADPRERAGAAAGHRARARRHLGGGGDGLPAGAAGGQLARPLRPRRRQRPLRRDGDARARAGVDRGRLRAEPAERLPRSGAGDGGGVRATAGGRPRGGLLPDRTRRGNAALAKRGDRRARLEDRATAADPAARRGRRDRPRRPRPARASHPRPRARPHLPARRAGR